MAAPDKGDTPRMKTSQERAADKREEKVREYEEQVRSGSLVVRQMTEEERKRFPPREPSDAEPRRRPRFTS